MSDYRLQLNRQSPLALYYQLKRILRAKIESGEFKDGDRLPSEFEFTSQHHVSRHLVRREIREGAPLFQINSFTWAENKKIFEFSSGYYWVDRFELEFQQSEGIKP